jgi:hypothetical protein
MSPALGPTDTRDLVPAMHILKPDNRIRLDPRIIGVLTIQPSSSPPEQKWLGVPVREPRRFAEHEDISDVPGHLLREIEHFFEVFKDLEGSATMRFSGERERRRLKSCLKRPSGWRRAKKSPPRGSPEPQLGTTTPHRIPLAALFSPESSQN